MGSLFSFKSKKSEKKPNDVFERGKHEAQIRMDEIKKKADPKYKRKGKLVPAAVLMGPTRPGAVPVPSTSTAPPSCVRSYDDVAIDDMRRQLNNDAEAFLLNNILLSVQFFENYEREIQQIKDKPISEGEKLINDAMILYNKHVFYADRLMECVSEHVNYQRNRGQLEALASPRVYVIFDNMEAREPGDTSDYSAALDAPFYKLKIEDCKESGYLMLKKQEILKSSLQKEKAINDIKEISDESVYPDSEDELNDLDDKLFHVGINSRKVNPKMESDDLKENHKNNKAKSSYSDNTQTGAVTAIKEIGLAMQCQNIVEMVDQEATKPKKSILKHHTLSSATTRYIRAKDSRLCYQNKKSSDGSECGSSGYGSTLSGSSTTTESAISKRIELHRCSSGVLSEECWTSVVKKLDSESDDEDEKKTSSAYKNVKADNSWSDEDDNEIIDSAYKARKFYTKYDYLNSIKFMNTFIVNFKQDLGSALGFSQEAIRNAMTLGASIYCDSFRNLLKTGYEIIPGLTATWPNAANTWIIRERKIIQNPRNNFKYQWPVQNMVSNARDFGCLLVPLGFRPKIGSNPDQKLQWRIAFPAAERYLESYLAHSHIRCYLFALVLHKTLMENEMMVGIDASHIKNLLFWQCEDNFAKWPEDRLGESLKSFLYSLYTHFGKSRLPNYFMESCNDFENIPASVLLLLQRKLKDILETPVMHMLYALDKLKYNSIGFYPIFNCQRLYEILTCRNPLQLSNPNLSANDFEESSGKQKRRIKTNVTLPKKLGTERRHLVLKFFISHFIAMARSSEKFNAVNQAMIYLEHAQRLCLLLLDEPGGDATADEYLNIIREKLADCHQKKVDQDGFKLRSRTENTDRSFQSQQRHKIERGVSQDSQPKEHGIAAITVADIHVEQQQRKELVTNDHQFSTNSADKVNEQILVLLDDGVIEVTHL